MYIIFQIIGKTRIYMHSYNTFLETIKVNVDKILKIYKLFRCTFLPTVHMFLFPTHKIIFSLII